MTDLVVSPTPKSILDSPSSFLSFFRTFIHTEVGDGVASDDTLKTYCSNLSQYLNWCEQHQLSPLQITRFHLKQYRHWLIDTQQYSPRTVALKLSVVRRFYDALIEYEYLPFNPAIGVKPPREIKDPAATINYLQQEEAYQLLNALPTECSLDSLRNRLLISVMVLEGCRTVEMHRLNVGDVISEADRLGLRVRGKRSIRVVPLTPDLSALLREYFKARRAQGEKLSSETPLFISLAYGSKGNRLSRRSIQRVVDKYLVKIGLKENTQPKTEKSLSEVTGETNSADEPKQKPKYPYQSKIRKLSAHSLRHTAGTLSLRAGASLRQVQDLLGHADPRTTVLYAHIADRWQNNPGLLLEQALRQVNS